MKLIQIRNTLLLLAVLAVSACATNPPNGPVYDPWENVNRKVFVFNDKVDKAIVAPVARGYRAVLPDPVENGIGNFFSNLNDVNVIVNDILQGKVKQAGSDIGRFLVNSTLGVFGIFDVGTRVGLPKHVENFGQTLGVWGIGEGPYVVLPLLGPNNMRSSVGFVTESATTYVPPYLTDDRGALLGTQVLELVSTRARLLGASTVLDGALDPYLLLRDYWVQQHRQATLDSTDRIILNSAKTSDDGDELDELDELDQLDELDELDQLDELDRLDELDKLDKTETQ